MRTFIVLLILLTAGMLFAETPSKPNLPISRQAADGWLSLFDSETTFGWQIDGEATVKDGELILGGDKETTARLTTEFGDAEIGIDHRVVDSKKPAELHYRGAKVELRGPNLASGIASEYVTASGGKLVHGVAVTVDGKRAESPAMKLSTSRDALTLRIPAGGTLVVRSIRLRPLETKPIFNGRNLIGWKEFPDRKSKFTVTSEGWINVKDGPGDLQTEGQWADFVLQLECISNGKHLNSGIFFRALPDQYQQGYEAQIRNQFTDEPTQKYILEEHDPKTNELKEKLEVKSTAVDYGTGAIYRRQPARKQMSKDGEWFTMTVAAHGRHLATWVNGVQVTDWTDNRPLKDNARNGCRLEKGCISIQGHDPTTDLSFRNLRLAELPPGNN